MTDAERKLWRLKWALRLWGPAWLNRLWLAAITVVVVLSLTSQQDEISGLCQVRVAQRHALEQQWANTEQYLDSPAGRERSGLNDFVRRISVPQLRERLRTETVPAACRSS